MTDTVKPHWSFWLVAVAGLAWHAGTVMNLFSQISADGIANLPEQYRAIAETRPAWATVGFAVAGFGGLIGSALLLLRRATAVPFFWASLAGVVVQMIPALGSAGSMNLGSIIVVFVMTLVVIGFLIWYARRAATAGILR